MASPLVLADQSILPHSLKRLLLQAHYEKALPELEALAQHNNSEAQFQLAKLYQQGLLGKPDKSRALALYEQSALLGHVNAQFYAAQMLIEEDGYSTQANAYLERAASQGHRMAKKQLEAIKAERANPASPENQLAFWEACRKGELDRVRQMLEQGLAIESMDAQGRTGLLLAVEFERKSLVEFLIKNGSNQNHQDNAGNTSLHYAVQNHDLAIATLLSSKKLLTLKNNQGMTPLFLAVTLNDDKLVKLLLTKGADAQTSFQGKTAYELAAQKNSAELMTLLAQHGAAIEKQSEDIALSVKRENLIKQLTFDQYKGWSELILAAWLGDEALLSWYLQQNNDLDSLVDAFERAYHSGNTNAPKLVLEKILHNHRLNDEVFLKVQGISLSQKNFQLFSYADAESIKQDYRASTQVNTLLLQQAIMSQQENFSKWLLSKTIDAQYLTEHKQTLLIQAIINDLDKIALKLIPKTKNLNQTDKFGRSALWYAADLGKLKLVQALIKENVKLDLPDEHQQTALLTAISNKHLSVARVLLEGGADLMHKNFSGNNALHLAVSSAQLELVEVLLNKGIELGARNNNSLTALIIAVQANQAEIVKKLLAAGAKPNRKDKNRLSAYDYAKDPSMQALLKSYDTSVPFLKAFTQ